MINDSGHPIYRDLMGSGPVAKNNDDAMTPISDWRELPFREIWVVDTEFYPGAGLANGGVEGDPLTPLCLVALEMRSGRLVRLWQDQLGPFPPYRLDDDALIVGYMLAAEFGVHIALRLGRAGMCARRLC